MEKQQLDTGAMLASFSAFVLWGLLPVYWKFFSNVPAYEVLAHRILWSFLFMIILVLLTRRVNGMMREIKVLAANRQKLLNLIGGAIFISGNWLTYIWAVNHDRVVESGLGYYISPLLQVLVGVVVFRERLSLWQYLAVGLAAVGVIYLTASYGTFPVVAMTLAITITCYGYCKKITGLTAISGMTLETAITAPLAFIFLTYTYATGHGYPIGVNSTFILLAGTGVITAIPLIMYTYSLNRIPLSIIGIIHYVSPTLTVLLGVFVYNEVFTRSHLISFGFIWSGLALFTVGNTRPLKRLEKILKGSPKA